MTTAIIGLNMLTGVTIAPVGAHIIRALRPRPSNWALAWVRNLAYTQHLRQRLYRRGRQNHVQLRNEDRPLPEVGFWFHRSLDDRVRVGVLLSVGMKALVCPVKNYESTLHHGMGCSARWCRLYRRSGPMRAPISPIP